MVALRFIDNCPALCIETARSHHELGMRAMAAAIRLASSEVSLLCPNDHLRRSSGSGRSPPQSRCCPSPRTYPDAAGPRPKEEENGGSGSFLVENKTRTLIKNVLRWCRLKMRIRGCMEPGGTPHQG